MIKITLLVAVVLRKGDSQSLVRSIPRQKKVEKWLLYIKLLEDYRQGQCQTYFLSICIHGHLLVPWDLTPKTSEIGFHLLNILKTINPKPYSPVELLEEQQQPKADLGCSETHSAAYA